MITNLYFDHVLATDTKEAAILRGRGRSRRVTPDEKLVRAYYLLFLSWGTFVILTSQI